MATNPVQFGVKPPEKTTPFGEVPTVPRYPSAMFYTDTSVAVQQPFWESMMAARGTHEAYGKDIYTRELEDKIRTLCGPQSQIFMTPSGTGAYKLACAMSGDSDTVRVLMTDSEHAAIRGANAVSHHKQLLPVGVEKLTADYLQAALDSQTRGAPFMPRPAVLEMGLSSSKGHIGPDQLKALIDKAHDNRMVVVVDAARGPQAGYSFQSLAQAGTDVICWGGTNQGMLNVEMAVFTDNYFKNYPRTRMKLDNPGELDPDLFRQDAMTYLKTAGMLQPKWEFASAQMLTSLDEPSPEQEAQKTVQKAIRLAKAIRESTSYQVMGPIHANYVLARVPKQDVEGLAPYYKFISSPIADTDDMQVKLMTSPQVTQDDIHQLVNTMAAIRSGNSKA